MRKWRVGTVVILAGLLGMLVGRVLLGEDHDLPGWVVAHLVLFGLAAWHDARFGFGKLVVIGLVAGGAGYLQLFDVGSGPHAWARSYSGNEQVGTWLLISSAGVVLIGVVWSSVSETPAGSKTVWAYFFGAGPGGSIAEPSQRGIAVDEGQSPPEGWWVAADGKWYPPELRAGYVPPPPGPDQPRTQWWLEWWAIAAGALIVLGIIGLVLFADSGNEVAQPAEFGDGATEDDDRGPVQDEEWRIDLGDEGSGIHTVFLIKTFSPLEEDDLQDQGGRLIWPETEVELCNIGIRAVGDGFLQVGDIFPTSEGCEDSSEMQQAFDDFGLPDTACVFVRSNGIEDEHCAPLTVD